MGVIIVGSGIAGVTFAEKYRSQSTDAITLLTRETLGYYSRPLLSNGFTRDNIEERIVLKSFDALRQNGIDVQSGVNVTAVDAAAKTVSCQSDDQTQTLGYDKLVLAQGSAALIPPPFRPHRRLFFVLNSLADLKRLRRHRQDIRDRGEKPRWAIIGGGLIGCEVASDLATAGDEVELFHAMPQLMERQLVEEDSAKLLGVLRKSGVKVYLDAAVTGFRETGETGKERTVVTETGERSGFHGIIVACGFKPRTDLAAAAGLEVNRGIVIDDFLRTSDAAIHAVGDVAKCADAKVYAYILPIRHQAQWLADHLSGAAENPWQPPPFKPKAKVHGFEADHPYKF